jgi:mutator protein MutT
MLEEHRRSRAALTLAVHQESYTIPHGAVTMQDGYVQSYREKPSHPVFIASAVTVLAQAALGLLPQAGPAGLPDLVNALIERGLPVRAFDHVAHWIDVNDRVALGRAEQLVMRFGKEFDCWARSPDLQVVDALLTGPSGVLLEKRQMSARCHPGLWDMPGGKIESGETPANAMSRELREELGISTTVGEPIAVFDDIDVASRLVLRHHVYSVPVESAAIEQQDGMQVQWFALDELSSLNPLNSVVTRAIATLKHVP